MSELPYNWAFESPAAQAPRPGLGRTAMHFEITSPCDEDWDAMEPRPGGRHCVRCNKTVIDLVGLTRAQAEARVRHVRAAEVCVQLAVNLDGDAVFAPPPSRAPHWSRGLVLVAALSAAGCGAGEAESGPEPAPLVASMGPPMTPVTVVVEPANPAQPTDPALATRAVPASELPAVSVAAPTAEQREQTRRKQEAAIPVHHMRGGMALRSF